jgi:hypothetical protein
MRSEVQKPATQTRNAVQTLAREQVVPVHAGDLDNDPGQFTAFYSAVTNIPGGIATG